MEYILLYFSLKYHGQFDLIYKALERKEHVDESLKKELFATIKCSYTTIISDDYPQHLKFINCPPFVLYYYGSLSLLDNECIGVIGKRDCSEYGVQATRILVEDLVKQGLVIVSGMAKGIDGVSHRTALKSNGHTVAVLGSGIDYPYPPMNKELYDQLKSELI
ncbi:DNA-processing protein DprA, partial [Catenibacterium sp.]|uniref:DNA-processing protein DprA n=1 Tax=Catenibacterium sp. TaxID=2049022 RepID=UPI003FD8EA2C